MNARTEEERKTRRAKWGFLQSLRYLERRAGSKPRIGQSRRLSQEVVDLGQDPYTGFAYDELSEVDVDAKTPRIRPRFLGFFGPFGPLPHSITREVDRWKRNGDNAFVRFADIFVARFQQLFYRSWSDARPITQYDHPTGGEFPRLLRSLTGDAPKCFDGTSPVDDVVRLRYTALSMDRVRSPVRLRQMLRAHFGVAVRVEEFVTGWLEFSPEDRSVMGRQGMRLGQDLRVGQRAPSISEKIVLHLECNSVDEYRSFLPGRDRQAELKDLVLGYLGAFFEIDVALWLPRAQIAPAQLGTTTELGWTSAMPMSQGGDVQNALVRATQYKISMEVS
ncbi:type VI secretion system baseplate subunit TssG [uncultured Tateyamaria sp.]|uniref:type VI secretion system baseplate subunit TssG n=1 Tax=Tateyamaria sp. 1078 TaxID=3417464 RepID=UPI00262480B9|nr:type VI secretion system baseplate subunit TssG [uncultured Tateyamaria sp.]